MAAVLEILFEFFGEIVLQLLAELISAQGLRAMRGPFSRQPSPWLALPGYALLGAACGGLSLLVAPALWVVSPALQLVNLAVTPLVAGSVMAALGSLRARRGQPVLRLDRFLCGVLFAFCMAAVRYLATR